MLVSTASCLSINVLTRTGAISLCLHVALQKDRGKQALAWIRDGSPANDSRRNDFDNRMTCYSQIWRVIQTVDALGSADPAVAQRKQEAYGIIDISEDEVFQNCLYDWYLEQNQSQRLMELKSPFVIAYLERKAANEKAAADLLWHYHIHHHQYFEAAKTQLHLAKSSFDISLEERLDYLSRAKANASTRVPTFGRLGGSKQEMIRTISDLLDCANVQLDVLHRLMTDKRVPEPNRTGVVVKLNGPIVSLSEVCIWMIPRLF
jgi:nuclear pore complex protein Nup155